MCGKSPRKYVPVTPNERYVGALVFDTSTPLGRQMHMAAAYGAERVEQVMTNIRKGEKREDSRTVVR